VAALTTNPELADAPGECPGAARALFQSPSDSVVNVSQLLTLDRSFLTKLPGTLTSGLQRAADKGLRTVLQL
jgi:mRNA interferase MazF